MALLTARRVRQGAPLESAAGAASRRPPQGLRALRRFLPFLRPVRRTLAFGLITGVLQATFQWISPWPLQVVFDSVLNRLPLPAWMSFMPAAPEARLAILSLAAVTIAVGLAIFSYASMYLLSLAGQRVVYDVRLALFTHLERQSLAFHQSRPTGDIMSRLSGDAQALQGVMVDAVPTLVNNAFTLTGITVIMFMVNWRFALITLALVPVLELSVGRLMGGLKAAVRQARRQEGIASGVAQEVLSSIAVVQVFGRETDEAARFASATRAGLAASRRATALQSALTTIAGAIMALGAVPVVWLGALAIMSGQMTAGELLVFTAYLRATYTPIRQMAKLAIVFGQGLAASERIAEILDANEELPQRPNPTAIPAGRGTLTFEGVSFAYPGAAAALADVDLHVPAGRRLAVVGATGSGKSTLVRLIPRFYDPTAGRVLLDGVDLRDLALAELRQQVALVAQEAYIFRGTVWENIAYGASGPRLTREAAIAAARAAGVDGVLRGLNDGYDTIVSERGSSLSGGQRQCISVARAMARDPRVLILDEPTTGLDAGAEALLLEALDRLAKGRTTVVISHQLSAVRNADEILVIDHGRVVERGSHAQLIASGGDYWRLHHAQTGGPPASPPPSASPPQPRPPSLSQSLLTSLTRVLPGVVR